MEVKERFERKLLKLFCPSPLTGTKQLLWTKTFDIFSVLTFHWRSETRFDEVSENFFEFFVFSFYWTAKCVFP